MKHLLHVLHYVVRNPSAAFWGVREFRLGSTKHYENWRSQESYDAGRELAHLATLRHWDDR